jgi:histidinol-phosphatase (PHP family)
MELNTSGVQKALPEMNPSPAQLAMMCERGIPVVLGADAHVPERVGDGYLTAMRKLQAAGYSEISYFIDRQRQSLAIDDAIASWISEE